MDKQLLAALNKTSDAIEALAEALNSKEKSTSASASALKSGDFGAQLKSINASLKSIKKDTQEILRQQKTIQSMSQKPAVKDDKDDPMSKMPTDKKKMDGLKKGLGVVLLLAVAVLAIGLAFKIVGKIDVLSVIGLAIGITIVSIAFEKVAQLNLSYKDAIRTSVVMVLIATAITASSWIMKLIIPISFTKLLTAIFISAMFVVISMKMREILTAAVLFGKMNVKPKVLLETMVSISAAITASSWILQLVKPVSFDQVVTAIAISVMFAIVSYSIDKMAIAALIFKRFNIKPSVLLKTLVSISAAITASSWVLQFIKPLTTEQLITGAAISFMFFLVAMNLEKIAMGVIAFEKTKVKAKELIICLVGISAAITASSMILDLVKPITDWNKIGTALAIAVLFAIMSYVLPELAVGVVIIEKALGKNKMFLIPLLFTSIALAIYLSSELFKKVPNIELTMIGKIFLIGIAIAVISMVLTPAIFLLALLGLKRVTTAALSIVILAGAIAAASQLMAKGKYDIFPGWRWSVFTAIAILAYGIVGWVLSKIGGIKDYIVGALIIVAMAGTIWIASKILNKGEYTKRPDMKWVLATAAGILAYGLLALAFGIIALSGVGAVAFLAGAGITLALAGLIVGVSLIFEKGEFTKYPSMKWNLSVIATLGSFGALALVLGTQVINPVFWAGFLVIYGLAKLVVKTADILSQGKYDLKGFASWAAGTVLLFATFSPLILILGAVAAASAALGFFTGINPFEMGKAAFISIAETIVAVSHELKKGTYSGGPTYEWAKGVSIALGAFAPVYKMLVDNEIMKIFGGGGIGPDDFRKAIETITDGIIAAAQKFSDNSVAFANGPPVEWARGVGKAIGAFAPVYKVIKEGSGVIFDSSDEDVEKMKKGIFAICEGIVEAAKFFAKNTAQFTEGKYPDPKWGRGVGGAIKAFAPVFSILSETPWYRNPEKQIKAMKDGIIWISEAIVKAGETFQKTTPDMWIAEKVPNKAWASGVSAAIKAFSGVFKIMTEESDSIWKSGEDVVKGLAFGIKEISNSIADAGNAFSKYGPGIFKAYPSVSWGVGVKMAVQSYLGIFDLLTAKKMTPEVFSKTAKTLEGGVISMSNVARILFSNSRFFTFKLDPSFVKNISGNLIEFAKLGILLDKMLVTIVSETSKSGGLFGIGGTTTTTQKRVMKDMGIVDKVAQAMANTARILFKNKNLFSAKIDPNFMKNLGRNVLDYVGLALYLTTKQAEIASITEEGNPIDKIAQSMTTLATGYDKLAAALERYARAIAMVTAVTGKPPKGAGIKKGPSDSSGGPSGMKREGQDSPSGTGVASGMKVPRKKTDLEIDIKTIIKHLDKMTKEGDSNPGLLRRILDTQLSTNYNLVAILEEIEAQGKKKKKSEDEG